MGILEDIKNHLTAVKEKIGTQISESEPKEPTFKFGEILWVVLDASEGKAINVPFITNEGGDSFTNLVTGDSFSGTQLEDCADKVCKSLGIERSHFLVFTSFDVLNGATKNLPELGNSRVVSDYSASLSSRNSKITGLDFCSTYSVSREDLLKFMESVSQARVAHTAKKRAQAEQGESSQEM